MEAQRDAARTGPMGRRVPSAIIGLVLLLAALGCREEPRAQEGREAQPPQRIVLIVSDTLRRDRLSPYGADIETPNLQRLADDGVVFQNIVSSFHQTTMSMSSLFTGRTPSIETGDPAESLPWTSRNWCGMARLAEVEDDTCIPASLDTLAEDLQGAGYETIGVLANALIFRPYGYDQGFERWIEVGEPERPDDPLTPVERAMRRTATHVNARVMDALAERRSDHFFLYVHYLEPHDYGIRPDLRNYRNGVEFMDKALGVLLDHLRTNGLLEDAVVVFTSDHGEYLGAEHALPATRKHFGNPSFDSLLKVPLIISPPRGGDPHRLVRTQDIRGMIREIAGLSPTPATDILPDEVFLTEQFYQTYRRGRWKSTWSRDGERMALFDLEHDPGETRDASAQHPEVIATHRSRVAALTESLGTRRGEDAELSPDDEDRLRALGYLE